MFSTKKFAICVSLCKKIAIYVDMYIVIDNCCLILLMKFIQKLRTYTMYVVNSRNFKPFWKFSKIGCDLFCFSSLHKDFVIYNIYTKFCIYVILRL